VNNKCIYNWPKKDEAILSCFKECYNHVFVAFPPFLKMDGDRGAITFWEKDIVSMHGELLNWSEVENLIGIESASNINEAMLFSFKYKEKEEYRINFEKLMKYCGENNIYWPEEARIDPFVACAVMCALSGEGYKSVVFDFHALKEYVEINEYMTPATLPVSKQFYPMHLYTPDGFFLMTSNHDYYYYLIASRDFELLEKVINEGRIEGFFVNEGDMPNWHVDDSRVIKFS